MYTSRGISTSLLAFPLLPIIAALNVPRNQSFEIIPRQALAPQRFGSVTQFESLCTGTLNQDKWLDTGMDDAVMTGLDARNLIDLGFQDALIETVPEVGQLSYTCGSQQPCDVSSLSLVCNDDPARVTMLKALANFSNFFQRFADTIRDAESFVDGQAARMQEFFNPQEEEDEGTNNALEGIGLALGVISPILGAIPGIPQLVGIGAGAAVLKELLTIFETEATDDAGFDSFADISSSTSAVVRNALRGVAATIDSALNTNDIFAEGHTLEIFSSGTFAAPINDLDASVQDGMIAALASPHINNLWNQQRAVVVKANRGLLNDLVDPCDGDTLFPREDKFCDGDDMYVVRRFPRFGEGDIQFNDADELALPGVDNLGQFGLTLAQVAEAAVRTQNDHGLFGKHESSALIDAVTSQDPSDISLADGIFFNFPVCNLISYELSSTGTIQCQNRFGDNEALCRFHTMMVCGCRVINIDGEDWPYTPNNFQCSAPGDEQVEF